MKKFLLIFTLLLFSSSVMIAVDENSEPFLQNLANSYTEWQNVEFSGKLHCSLLPLSPSVKIYMERDSLIQISVRVSLMGEVMRVEINPREVVAVNKMKGNYFSQPLAQAFKHDPYALRELQSIFLARVIVPGKGEFAPHLVDAFSFVKDVDGNYVLLPNSEELTEYVNYGFLVDPGYHTIALMTLIYGKGNAELIYSYKQNSMAMDITLDINDKKVNAQLDFNSVKYGGSRMSAINYKKYTRLNSLREMIKNIL
ncbi:MAG: DUF4292 domain-containing protein [Lepagella sp.]